MANSASDIDDSSSLYGILKHLTKYQSYDSLPIEDFSDTYLTADYDINGSIYFDNYADMRACNHNGNNSCSSCTSENLSGDNLLRVGEHGRLSLAYENLDSIPKQVAEKYAEQTQFLDLGYNSIKNLSFLSVFRGLHTLVLDKNTNLDVTTLPFLQNLKILWINNCDIRNVVDWIQRIRIQCPALEYLSIMGNPGIRVPYNDSNINLLNDASNIETKRMASSNFVDYKYYILNMLPDLQYLDGIPRSNMLQIIQKTSISLTSSTTSSSLSTPHSVQKSSSSVGRKHYNATPQKNSSFLCFKELCTLKWLKNSYRSSSKN